MMRDTGIRWMVMSLLAVWLAGCVTPAGSGPLRAPVYRPDESGRNVAAWMDVLKATVTLPVAGVGDVSPVPGPGVVVTAVPGSRTLRRGDKVSVSLAGIPEAMEIKNAVNDIGEITLPFIGSVRVEDLTTAEAQRMIQTRYIQEGYFRSIDIIIMAEVGTFYVLGEVKREGSFPLSGDVTLMQAVSMAGGYTDFADRAKIHIYRGGETLEFDRRKIERQEARDPVVMNGDTIRVPRGWM